VIDHQPLQAAIGWWYWNASRVIPDTINEFPIFSFLYADLHAHLMALPFTLVVLGLSVNFVVRGHADEGRLPFLSQIPVSPADLIEVVVAALALGALRAINYADYATYQLVVAAALAVGEYGRRRRIDLRGVVGFAWRLVVVFLLSSLLWQPFVSNFATAYLSVGLWSGARTTIDQYLVVYGIFLFVIGTYLLWQTFDSKVTRGPFRFLRLAIARSGRLDRVLALQRVFAAPPTAYEDLAAAIILIGMILEGVVLVAQLFVFALMLPFLVLAGLLVLRPDLEPARRLIALLIAASIALTLVVEFVVYEGDIGRMNTVFKFYLQVWVMFGVTGAAGLAAIMKTAAARRSGAPAAAPASTPAASAPALATWWWAAFALLVFAGLLYPATAIPAKVNDRFVSGSPPGLNGMDYMRTAVYNDQSANLVLEYDREAIDWIRENIPGSPVMLEGNAPLYRWGSRIAVYTGLPTVIGWDWHEKQQRSVIDPAIIDQRVQAVRDMYNNPDVDAAVKLMNDYRVKYIYVGDLEREYYEAAGLMKFDEMVSTGAAQVVYQNDHVKIYELKGSGA
jgi:YYY domain-containing protein